VDDPPGRAADIVVGAYVPRPIRFLRREEVGEWRIKIYGIAAQGELPRDELVAATVRIAGDVLPQPALTDDRYGIAFATAHDAATASIAIVYWWQSQNELHQRIYAGPREDVARMRQLEDQPAGCVWELGVVDFESRAWRDDVLANPAGPDVELYLSRALNAVF
jgi:hypothetical protein